MSRLRRGRPASAQAARRLLEHSPVRDRLLPYLDRHADERFVALDAAMADADLAALIVSSTLNMQEIAGVPVASKHRPLGAVYLPGDTNAWVIDQRRSAGGREFVPVEA